MILGNNRNFIDFIWPFCLSRKSSWMQKILLWRGSAVISLWITRNFYDAKMPVSTIQDTSRNMLQVSDLLHFVVVLFVNLPTSSGVTSLTLGSHVPPYAMKQPWRIRANTSREQLLADKITIAWWRHQMETFSALLAGEFSAQRPTTRTFGVFFDLRLNGRLSKQSWGWWFETPSRPLWRQSNEHLAYHNTNLHILWGILHIWLWPIWCSWTT